MRLKWRDVFARLQSATEKELNMEVQVGFPDVVLPATRLVFAQSLEHISDATDVDDLCGNTLILETAA